MKTAEEILKSKLDPKIAVVNNPDYTFNKVIEAMEEYANQFKTGCIHPKDSQYISDAGCYCQKCGEEITIKNK